MQLEYEGYTEGPAGACCLHTMLCIGALSEAEPQRRHCCKL